MRMCSSVVVALAVAVAACAAGGKGTEADLGSGPAAPALPSPPDGPKGSFGGDAGNPKDKDGDGYEVGDDCDDQDKRVNPGALELPGDGIDNDCNGLIDEPAAVCDTGLAMTSTAAMDFARSLGLCATTSAGATGKARTWGVISSAIETTDGVGAPLARQHAIQRAWGPMVTPKAGESMVALSTGVARTPGQPDYVALPKDLDSSTNANNPPPGFPKNAMGCPVTSVHAAFDSVVLRLSLRVPTNVSALSFDFKFYTSEYCEYVCQAYNDSFVALLDTKAPLDPKLDKNVSVGTNGDPINVNSAFFQACSPDTGLNGRKFTCPLGTSELAGTGFDATPAALGKFAMNGATDWLRTTAPVIPGETVTIRLMMWNVGDHRLQSSVLVDNWSWHPEVVASPTTNPVR